MSVDINVRVMGAIEVFRSILPAVESFDSHPSMGSINLSRGGSSLSAIPGPVSHSSARAVSREDTASALGVTNGYIA